MRISLVGYMGSGKSTVGNILSDRLNLSFFDLDELIASKFNLSIPEIFKLYGEIKFRKMEKDILAEFLDQNDDYVLAVGGGTPVFYDNMAKLNQLSEVVYLRLNPMNLSNRLAKVKMQRPLIAHLDDDALPEFIAKHLFERRQFYELAKFTIDCNSKSEAEVVELILNELLDQSSSKEA